MSKSMQEALDCVHRGAYAALVFRYHRNGITAETAKKLAREALERNSA